MGKLHSKYAAVCKPRESPEGDSFVVNACLARKGIEDWVAKQECQHRSNCSFPRNSSHQVCGGEAIGNRHYRLEVALPPEKTDSCCAEDKLQVRGGTTGARKQLKFEELECAVALEENNRQEWTFTLYDFDNNGRVTRDDITSLLHTIYEVVDASVNHSPSTSKTLRVKLSVAPDSSQWAAADVSHARQKTDKGFEDPRCSDKKIRALLRRHQNDPTAPPACQRPSVDENLERRNHYLDLAGIENYTSRFGSGTAAEHSSRPMNQGRSRSHEPENGTGFQHHRRSHMADTAAHEVVCHALRSPKHAARPPAGHTSHRAVRSQVAPPQPAPLTHGSAHLQPTGPYRRHKQRARDSEQVRDLASLLLYEGTLSQVVQRHQHHHHHEHHHHYHHFYQS